MIESTSIESSGGMVYTYEQLQTLTTEEGLNEYYRQQNIKPGIIGKKQFQKNLESNKQLVDEVRKQLGNIVFDLDESLCKKKNEDDW